MAAEEPVDLPADDLTQFGATGQLFRSVTSPAFPSLAPKDWAKLDSLDRQRLIEAGNGRRRIHAPVAPTAWRAISDRRSAVRVCDRAMPLPYDERAPHGRPTRLLR
ncbi:MULTISPECIES: hypothetical protein [Mycolicibacterium]|uniref:Uncharacterized protein n=1 Tax=Mycolicibacterium mucogenicum TaxID=56689 RepID=A0A1A0MFZ8_MYCMU|nr:MULTISPECIES: hypothetical protein [Mycolicibacterium]OBA83718.1 hypothetical protein A5642_26460 [Mycolicibacterium mucogenicum]GCA97245.1 hypothetical protein NCCNTM_08800 [Mycolicibacterium sp. NCC-Tsukiji]